MLMPKRTKYRKPHRLSYEGKTKGNKEISFGEYGLMAKEGGYVTARQIEAARIAMTRYMKRGGKVWINIFPQLARTQKPLETRQGKGKGDVKEWAAVVKEGKIIFNDNETSLISDKVPSEYWTEEKKNLFNEKLRKNINELLDDVCTSCN